MPIFHYTKYEFVVPCIHTRKRKKKKGEGGGVSPSFSLSLLLSPCPLLPHIKSSSNQVGLLLELKHIIKGRKRN
jgi:hypothetical protein